jgi:hypothetical protein
MAMRSLVALLLLANLAFLALAQGWLQPLAGLSTQQQREPQRLAAQLQPEAVRIVAPAAAASAQAAAAAAATACLQAGPFEAAQVAAVEARLAQAQLPAGSWRRLPADAAGDWRVQLGGFADAAAMQTERDTLQRQGIATEVLAGDAATPGALLLGRYADRAAAEAALAQWRGRGLGEAELSAPGLLQEVLRIDQADAALQAKLQALSPQLPGGGFSACAR